MARREWGSMAFFACLIALCAVAGISSQEPEKPPISESFAHRFLVDVQAGQYARVVMDLPIEMREANWGGGSCVHATTVNLLRWQGQPDIAAWWRSAYSGGESSSRLVRRMEAAGLRYSYTTTGQIGFLEWAVRTGRGAGLFYKPRHAVNLVGLDAKYAYLLDNNDINHPERVGRYERVPRDVFEARWRAYGGIAWTLVYQPPPPLPSR